MEQKRLQTKALKQKLKSWSMAQTFTHLKILVNILMLYIKK